MSLQRVSLVGIVFNQTVEQDLAIKASFYYLRETGACLKSWSASEHAIRQNIVSNFLRFLALAPKNSKSFLKDMYMINKGLIEPVYMVQQKIKMAAVCQS